MSLSLVLLGLLGFQLKHFLCDFVLQTKWQVDTKKIYGAGGGFVHAGLHAGATLAVLYYLGVSMTVMLVIAAGEFVLHYHVDWLKGQVDEWTGWNEKNAMYWVVFGTDQLIHQLTYLGIIAYLAGAL